MRSMAGEARTNAALRASQVLAVPVAVGVVAMAAARDVTGDWDFFTGIARMLLGSEGLSVYAAHPECQTGPLSLLLTALLAPHGRVALSAAVLVTGLVALRWATRLAVGRNLITTWALGSLLMVWWPYLATSGHLDDALTLALASAATAMTVQGRRGPAAVLLGISLAIKPWSVFLLPLTWQPGTGVRGWRPPALSVFIGALMWSPFLVAAPRTFGGLQPQLRIAPDSLFRLLGIDASSTIIHSLRLPQLLLSAAVVMIAVRQGRHAGALLGGIAVRMLLDPGTWNYYTAGFVLGAVMWDFHRARRLPVASLVATFTLLPNWMLSDLPVVRGLLRLAGCLVAIALVCTPERPVAHDASASTTAANDLVAV